MSRPALPPEPGRAGTADPGTDDTPAWFRTALRRSPATGSTEVDGARIAYRAWGAPDAPPIVLLHGVAAHSRWWDAVAPALAERHRVVAIDFSGHGDSEHRTGYSKAVWAAEVHA